MHNLITINGVEFPTPEGSFDIKYEDKTNIHEGENGKKTVEIIRKDIASISVSYNGLKEEELNRLHAALDTVNKVTFYKKGVETTADMRLSSVSTPKKYFKGGITVWGMSFSLEEL